MTAPDTDRRAQAMTDRGLAALIREEAARGPGALQGLALELFDIGALILRAEDVPMTCLCRGLAVKGNSTPALMRGLAEALDTRAAKTARTTPRRTPA